jgi:uncharacterized membrane protein
LAFDEIRFCGATSIQVMRRMKALVSDLIHALPEERHEPLKHHQKRLNSTIARSFADPEEQLEAAVEDRQARRSALTLGRPTLAIGMGNERKSR